MLWKYKSEIALYQFSDKNININGYKQNDNILQKYINVHFILN